MEILKKYNNYELHPFKTIDGFSEQAWEGKDAVVNELSKCAVSLLQKNEKVVICLDYYPGVDKNDILGLVEHLNPNYIFDMEDFAKDETRLNEEFNDFITDDRVFGVICHKKLEDFFENDMLLEAKDKLNRIAKGLIVIAGVGAGLISQGDIYVYGSITRWEIQLRYRNGMPNWHCTNDTADHLSKNKRGYFVEWRLADHYKKSRYEQFDFVLESEEKGNFKLITGDAFRAGLDKLSGEPFRLEPYFDPGVWGGHWMQTQFDLDPNQDNFAWSFDGVPEENSLNLDFGGVRVKLPAIDLVLYRPERLLGKRVYGRFGAEFPIRFDLLDTMGGGNLSLQVHPLTEYIQDMFGMPYTQDESYYILDADESQETHVYLGVKDGVDKEAMGRDLRRADKGEIQFPVDNYVNRVPVKKHDHILIPAGTIHCSGKNTMVLEISATPYIFTFKLWDWGRVGMDGMPRPIHIDHGLNNIQWERNTDWIYDNLIHQEEVLNEEPGCKVERTGLHDLEFIDTIRYSLAEEITIEHNDSVHVMNLVDGECAEIQSMDGSFQPFEIHYAETVIVPASVGRYRIVPVAGDIKMVIASIRK